MFFFTGTVFAVRSGVFVMTQAYSVAEGVEPGVFRWLLEGKGR